MKHNTVQKAIAYNFIYRSKKYPLLKLIKEKEEKNVGFLYQQEIYRMLNRNSITVECDILFLYLVPHYRHTSSTEFTLMKQIYREENLRDVVDLKEDKIKKLNEFIISIELPELEISPNDVTKVIELITSEL